MIILRLLTPLLLLLSSLPIQAQDGVTYYLEVDLDRTIIKLDKRIQAIVRDIGREERIPQLASLQLEEVEYIVKGDWNKIGLTDAATIRKVFGSRQDRESRKASLFAKKFFKAPKYFKYDQEVKGAAKYYKKILRALIRAHKNNPDARVKIWYNTGRLKEYMLEGTEEELARLNMPGFGNEAEEFKDHFELSLKPESYAGRIEDYKLENTLEKLSRGDHVLLLADDSAKNLDKISPHLAGDTIYLNAGDETPADTSKKATYFKIKDYTDKKQRNAIIEHLKNCSRALPDGAYLEF